MRERCVNSTARRVEVVECEVAVGDGVDRVAHRVRRRRQRQRRAGERAGTERRRRRLRCRRTRTARGRARASRPTRADGDRASPAAHAAGACSPASASSPRGGTRRASRARTPSSAALAPRRTRPRRRAGTPPRPGRCASGRRGSCARLHRAAARSTSARLRRRGRSSSIAASRSVTSASSSSSRMPAGVQALARAGASPATSYGSSSASSARRKAHTSGRELGRDPSGPERHRRPSELGEHPACVGDVVDLHGELSDPVGRGEGSCAALHAQPLGVVRQRVALRVEDRVVVAASQLDRHRCR